MRLSQYIVVVEDGGDFNLENWARGPGLNAGWATFNSCVLSSPFDEFTFWPTPIAEIRKFVKTLTNLGISRDSINVYKTGVKPIKL